MLFERVSLFDTEHSAETKTRSPAHWELRPYVAMVGEKGALNKCPTGRPSITSSNGGLGGHALFRLFSFLLLFFLTLQLVGCSDKRTRIVELGDGKYQVEQKGYDGDWYEDWFPSASPFKTIEEARAFRHEVEKAYWIRDKQNSHRKVVE